MKIKLNVDTKWHGCHESVIVDIGDTGYPDEMWDNLSEEVQYNELLELAHEAIGFSFSYNYMD